MKLTDYIAPVAKAVAAFVTPLIVAALLWLVDRTGADYPINPDAINVGVTAIVTAIAVWAVRNRPTT
jgi:hypothetical protein